MATDAILETIKPRRRSEEETLPVTTAAGSAGTKSGGGIGLRRRMSSFSVHVTPPSVSALSSSSVAAFRRARSMPSVKALAAAGALRRWWDWGLGWVTAPFAAPPPSSTRGMELDDDDEARRPLGGGCCGGAGDGGSPAAGGGGGGWRHVMVRLRAGARRLLGRDGRPLKAAAPQDFGYDSVSYKHNFDDGEA